METDVGTVQTAVKIRAEAVFPILIAASFCHFLNDMVQSLLPAIYRYSKNRLSSTSD